MSNLESMFSFKWVNLKKEKRKTAKGLLVSLSGQSQWSWGSKCSHSLESHPCRLSQLQSALSGGRRGDKGQLQFLIFGIQ